ncbi:hypothetical protein C5S29_05560 [ANME-1 cluster archaeon GoMg3.2]|nr:hypothetical protein [ANME-1 cluster archaeon GoMg3.2]
MAPIQCELYNSITAKTAHVLTGRKVVAKWSTRGGAEREEKPKPTILMGFGEIIEE